jgi:hypothetical protein
MIEHQLLSSLQGVGLGHRVGHATVEVCAERLGHSGGVRVWLVL